MKIRFDPRGLLYFVLLLAGISGGSAVLTMIREGALAPSFVVWFAFGVLAGRMVFSAFRIPLLVRLGGSSRLIRELHGRLLRETAPVRRFQLHNYLFYIYFRRWKIRAARAELLKIESEFLPEVLRAVVHINLAGTALLLDRYDAAKRELDAVDPEGLPRRIAAVWMVNRASYLYGSDLDPLQGAEFAHGALRRSGDPRVSAPLAGLLCRAGEYDAALAWIRYGLKNVRKRERYTRALLYLHLSEVFLQRAEPRESAAAAAAGLRICPGTLPLYRQLKKRV